MANATGTRAPMVTDPIGVLVADRFRIVRTNSIVLYLRMDISD